MFEVLKKWWAARPRWNGGDVVYGRTWNKPRQKIRLSIVDIFADGSTKIFKINDWVVTYTFGSGPTISQATDGDLLRTLLDPKYKDCWSGDVFAVKVLLKSGEINERNYP